MGGHGVGDGERMKESAMIIYSHCLCHSSLEILKALCSVPLDFWTCFELAEQEAGLGYPTLFWLDPGANRGGKKTLASPQDRLQVAGHECQLGLENFRTLLLHF